MSAINLFYLTTISHYKQLNGAQTQIICYITNAGMNKFSFNSFRNITFHKTGITNKATVMKSDV